ncbi:hypothetical protein PQR65_13450 [Paraburkholderia nemoris]
MRMMQTVLMVPVTALMAGCAGFGSNGFSGGQSSRQASSQIPPEIRYAVTSETAQDFSGGYWRIEGNLAEPLNGSASLPGVSVTDALATEFKNHFWSQNTLLTVTVQASGPSMPAFPAHQIIQIDGDGNIEASGTTTFWLTTPMKNVSPAEIKITSGRTDTTKSQLVETLSSLMVSAAPLVNGAFALTDAVKPQIASLSQKIDTQLSQAFSQQQQKVLQPPFTPYAYDGQQAYSKLTISYVASGKTVNLLTISNQHLETIFSGSSKFANVRANATDILDFPLDNATPQTTVRSAMQAQPAVTWLSSASVENIQSFCNQIDAALDTKLGLSSEDRAAVEWAYLMGTPWTSPKGRPTNSGDACVPLLQPLRASLPQLLIPQIASADGNDNSKTWSAGASLRQHGIPAAIQGNDPATRENLWSAILSDAVTLTAVARGVGAGSEAISANTSHNDLSKAEAARLLSSLNLKWNANSPCFASVSAQASHLYITAKASCVTLTDASSGAAIPMGMTFLLESENTPLIKEIWFFDDTVASSQSASN